MSKCFKFHCIQVLLFIVKYYYRTIWCKLNATAALLQEGVGMETEKEGREG